MRKQPSLLGDSTGLEYHRNSLRKSLSQPQASEGKRHHRTTRTCRDSSFSTATSSGRLPVCWSAHWGF